SLVSVSLPVSLDNLERFLSNQCNTRSDKTWSTTARDRKRLIVAQRNMMRKMIGVTRMDRISNVSLAQRIPLTDIRIKVMIKKRKWAERLSLLTDDRWSKRVLEWRPWNRKRPVGRPKVRWRDELTNEHGPQWQQVCRDDK